MAQRIIIPGFRKIETSGGGEGGTSNYNDLTNKPFINNVPVVGNLNTVDLKLTDATLTEEGVPADAKAVGTKLEESVSELKGDLVHLSSKTASNETKAYDITDLFTFPFTYSFHRVSCHIYRMVVFIRIY